MLVNAAQRARLHQPLKAVTARFTPTGLCPALSLTPSLARRAVRPPLSLRACGAQEHGTAVQRRQLSKGGSRHRTTVI